MTSFRSTRFAFAVAGVALAGLVGCASGNDGSGDTTSSTTTSSTTTSSTTTSSTTTSSTSAGGGGSGATGGQGGSGAIGAGGSGATGGQGGSGATGGQGGSGATGGQGGSGATGGQGGSGGSGPVGGDSCGSALDVSAETFPYALAGQFDGDPTEGGSCDSTPTNAVWFSYTAPTTGSYRIDLANATGTVAYSVAAVFDGTACNPLASELACATADDTVISATVDLVQGQSYLVLFHTDGDAYTMVDPTISITEIVAGPGDTCALARDVTSETFPYQHTGQFDIDPTEGGSCDTTPTNAVWFSYTAPADGNYRFDLVNQTATNAYSVLALFDGTACGPLGTQLSCTTASGTSISATATLAQGQSYLVLFHTDGDAYTMIDPQISVTELPPAVPGETCAQARDVTSETFPFTLAGTFGAEPGVGGSCDTTPTNAVWFSYTAPADGDYRFDLVNQTATNAYSVLALFDGIACGPLGTQLSCTTASGKSISATATLAQGQSYLVLFHTDGDGFTMLDPQITVTQLPPAVPGESCSSAYDASAETFPFTLAGTFGADPGVGGSCDTTPTNAVWFSYAPATSGLYQIDLTNQTATFAYSVAAVFDGAACSPLGAQLSCVTASSKSASTSVYLEQGKSYRILFHTDGDSYTMVDPTLTVTSVPVSPGGLCQVAYDVSAETFPFTLTGTFEDDPTVGGSCDTTPTNVVWFSFTPSATASYTVSLVNHTGTFAYSRVAVFTGLGCVPYGSQVACTTASSTSVSTSATLTAGQPYLIAFYTDGNAYTMVDPEITITP
ncbi:MAG: hypothetical protein IT373_30215 [Polyangiaceae bacterium]|nr:hypothetical protein [Polyangiaceae bacterium]